MPTDRTVPPQRDQPSGRDASGPADAADLRACLRAWAELQPDAAALTAIDRRPTRFADLVEETGRAGAVLRDWGIGRGDLVAWPVADRVESAAALAIVPAVATLAPLDPNWTAEAYADLFARVPVKAVVTPTRPDHPIVHAARARGIAEIALRPRREGTAGAFDLVPMREGLSLRAPRAVGTDVLYVSASSGTTGHPKLVPAAWDAVRITARALGRRLAIGPGAASAHVTPLHLGNGMRTAFLLALLNGGAVHCLPLADVGALLRAIATGAATYLSASFAIQRELLARIGAGLRGGHGRLRFIRVASGRLDDAEMDALEAAAGVPVVTGLSSTETGTIAQQQLPPAPRRRGSCGLPVASELRIVDAGNRVVAPGEVGEIQVRGPQVCAGYVADPELDRTMFVDGWFRMGDLGRLDERGELHVVGRIKEAINRGGEKFAPDEIDAAMRAVPGVADAAAFALAHPRLGEEVVGAVVLRPGASVSADEVTASVRAALGPRRAPRRIWFVDRLPRTAGGKLLRESLSRWVASDPIAWPDATAAPPGTADPLETALAALWSAALRVPVAANDEFHALGGDAECAAALLGQVSAVFGIALPPDSLAGEAGTVAGMAACIRRVQAHGVDGPRGDVPASGAGAVPPPRGDLACDGVR